MSVNFEFFCFCRWSWSSQNSTTFTWAAPRRAHFGGEPTQNIYTIADVWVFIAATLFINLLMLKISHFSETAVFTFCMKRSLYVRLFELSLNRTLAPNTISGCLERSDNALRCARPFWSNVLGLFRPAGEKITSKPNAGAGIAHFDYQWCDLKFPSGLVFTFSVEQSENSSPAHWYLIKLCWSDLMKFRRTSKITLV